MTHSPFGLAVGAGRTLLIAVAIVILVGCGGKDDHASVSSPSPSATPVRTAADGTNLNACKDGSCEVRVTLPVKIPVDSKRFKVSGLRAESSGSGAVLFSLKGLGVSRVCFSMGCSEGSPGTDFQAPAGAGERVTANQISITVVSVTDGLAIFRLSPAA